MNFDLKQLFDQFTVVDSMVFMAFCLAAFILGLLFGYILRGRQVRRLRQELKKKDEQIKELEHNLQQAQEQVTLREADLKRAQNELEAYKARLDSELRAIRQLREENEALTEANQNLETANRNYADTVEDLNDQILGLRARQGSEPPSGPNTDQRLAAVENRLQQLERENQRLRKMVDDLEPEGTAKAPLSAAAPDEDPEPEVHRQDSTTDVLAVDKALLRHTEHDDLTLINGLGPFLEKKLNDIGIHTYAQIAALDEERIAQVTRDIQFFPGRIQKDDWVGQAIALMALKEKDPAALEARAEIDGGDNLKQVEGIGPKVEAILKKAGILTFDQLAKSDPGELEAILEAADPRFRMLDPGTWPAQARLAANEEWDVLRDYQEQLTGGKERE